jgi:uncharacterized protein YtpQ (UPF0354 family)
VPPRGLPLLACLLAALVGCSGGDGADGENTVLSPTSFAQIVSAELRAADLEAAEQGGDVRVEDGLNWIELRLEEPFSAYRREPERRDDIVAEVVREATRRLEEGLAGLTFSQARSSLMPLLKPRFALRSVKEEPAATRFPAELAVIYAVEREDAFTVVTASDVERWRRPLVDVHKAAVANLLRQTNEEDPLLCEPSGGSELCGWASGDGYDATRMVVPELRGQIEEVYDGPAVYAVPREDVFVALSQQVATRGRTERLLRARVQRDFGTAENPVSPELFVERRGKLVVFAA